MVASNSNYLGAQCVKRFQQQTVPRVEAVFVVPNRLNAGNRRRLIEIIHSLCTIVYADEPLCEMLLFV